MAFFKQCKLLNIFLGEKREKNRRRKKLYKGRFKKIYIYLYRLSPHEGWGVWAKSTCPVFSSRFFQKAPKII